MTDKQCCNFSVVINIITIRSFYINYFDTIGESGFLNSIKLFLLFSTEISSTEYRDVAYAQYRDVQVLRCPDTILWMVLKMNKGKILF
jgi:hypothetical protein